MQSLYGNMIDFKRIEACVREAGEMILNASLSQGDIYKKEGAANFCTEYDLKVQRFLIKALSEILPSADFYGEEETENNLLSENSEYTFYIDPIDGTTNFMYNYHHSCVSVGLKNKDEMIAGFVYNPYVNEMYSAIRGKGAFLNGKQLKIKNLPIEEGIVAFGCARYNELNIDILLGSLKELFLNSLSIRSGGSAALDICRVASGSNVIYLELKLQPYDYAAASVIVEEAGGVISEISGSGVRFDAPSSVLCGTRLASAQTRKIVLSNGYSAE